jgi:hypothetical protein
VPLGEPENWIGEERLRKKFLFLAGRVFGDEHAIRIADAVCNLGMEGSVRALAQMTRRHKA